MTGSDRDVIGERSVRKGSREEESILPFCLGEDASRLSCLEFLLGLENCRWEIVRYVTSPVDGRYHGAWELISTWR